MKEFIFVKQVTNKTIDKKEKRTDITRKIIPVRKIDSITETEMRINFSELEPSCKNRYNNIDIDNATISQIYFKEPDKESNTNSIFVIGSPDDFIDYLNS